jgi:hypothetical protein
VGGEIFFRGKKKWAGSFYEGNSADAIVSIPSTLILYIYIKYIYIYFSRVCVSRPECMRARRAGIEVKSCFLFSNIFYAVSK